MANGNSRGNGTYVGRDIGNSAYPMGVTVQPIGESILPRGNGGRLMPGEEPRRDAPTNGTAKLQDEILGLNVGDNLAGYVTRVAKGIEDGKARYKGVVEGRIWDAVFHTKILSYTNDLARSARDARVGTDEERSALAEKILGLHDAAPMLPDEYGKRLLEIAGSLNRRKCPGTVGVYIELEETPQPGNGGNGAYATVGAIPVSEGIDPNKTMLGVIVRNLDRRPQERNENATVVGLGLDAHDYVFRYQRMLTHIRRVVDLDGLTEEQLKDYRSVAGAVLQLLETHRGELGESPLQLDAFDKVKSNYEVFRGDLEAKLKKLEGSNHKT